MKDGKPDHTPEPGIRIDDDRTKAVVKAFYSTFNIVRTDIPAACNLIGDRAPSVLFAREFRERPSLYVLFQFADCLYAASGQEIRHYIRSRHPWEDNDMCIFDTGMKWCIGITHNRYVVTVNREALIGRM